MAGPFYIGGSVFAEVVDQHSEASGCAVSRLSLGVLVLVPQIPPAAVAERAVHIECVDPLWRAHLTKRLENSGFSNISAMYTDEQKKVRQLLAKQQLQYEILDAIELTPDH